ncbi:MAG: hypothetical protein GY864_11225 [Desulfobacterales bacterium]|nr:hypothetical protein [Desulfobacterales bacterium]
MKKIFTLLFVLTFVLISSDLLYAQIGGVTVDGSGNVGIGITGSPVSKLDVGGTITSDDGNSAEWSEAYNWEDHGIQGYITAETDPTFFDSPAYYIKQIDIWNWNQWVEHPSQMFLSYETDPVFSSHFTVDGSGNIGIGITSPKSKLDINGTINTTFDGDSTQWNTAYGWGDHGDQNYITSSTGAETDPQVGPNTDNYVPKWNGTALVDSAIYDDNATNVGIGTTNPQGKLHVTDGAGSSSMLWSAVGISTTDPITILPDNSVSNICGGLYIIDTPTNAFTGVILASPAGDPWVVPHISFVVSGTGALIITLGSNGPYNVLLDLLWN